MESKGELTAAIPPSSLNVVQDWPPEAKLEESHPELYDDFIAALPVPAYMKRNGVLNLAAHFPTNSPVQPDLGLCSSLSSCGIYLRSEYLGPKVYMALASQQKDGYSGSTRLHCDLSDAVNILVFSTPADGTALWHIFKATDAPKIRHYIRTKFSCSSADPIHSQNFYLGPSHLEELRSIYSVIPFIIVQRVGEAVCVPAGCPHQVGFHSSDIY